MLAESLGSRSLSDKQLLEIARASQEAYGCHGFDHTERVIKLCEVIGEELGANMEVLIPAAILHDIGRPMDNHAKVGAKKAKKILEEKGYRDVDLIVHAIEVHSFSAGGEAKTLEARILSDSDKLDAIGAIGIYRAAQYATENSRTFDDFIGHFPEKLLKLKYMMYTDKARNMAEKRHEYLLAFLKQVEKELEGLV